jgi:hypothetical protein
VIRAQVATALDILPAFQQGVVDHYRQTGAVPADRNEAGLTSIKTDTSTSYISEVDVDNGSIVVRFGNDAHPLIQGHTLAFTPYETVDMTVVWRCGWEPQPPGTALLGTTGGTRIATYTPSTLAGYLHPRPCITQPSSAANDVISMQVLEPFDVIETFKDAVETAGAAAGSPSEPVPPADRLGAGLTPDYTDTFGHYFSSVAIANGTITVTYNTTETNPAIRGDTITWTPYETPDGTIIWRCGNQLHPAGAQLMGSTSAVRVAAYTAPTMPNLYLPNDCRP